MSQSAYAAFRERAGVAFGASGGGGGGGTQTVQTVQQIPAFEQEYAQQNQDIARSLAAQPYPVYQAPLVAGLTPTQQAGQSMAINAANSYQPGLNAAQVATAGQFDPSSAGNQAINAGVGTIGSVYAGNPANPGVIQSYMNPFVQSALQPQVAALNEQLGQQQKQIDQQATSANAFGDARQGAQSALANFYGNQSMAGLLGAGYNQAYNNALQTAQQQQQLGLQGGQALAQIGLGQRGADLQSAQQLAGIAGQQQQLGLQGANAVYDVGQQQQQVEQQAYNVAYQQYLNQVQWPYSNLNTRISALSNSPYNMTSNVTLPAANQTASNLGAFAGLAGLLGGGMSGGSQPPFGGSIYNPSTAKVG